MVTDATAARRKEDALTEKKWLTKKAMAGTPTAEGLGTRDYYTAARDTIQKKILEAAAQDQAWFNKHVLPQAKAYAQTNNISVVDTPMYTAHPTMVRRKAQARAAKQGIAGAYDLHARGKCGELGFTCGMLFKDGYLACNGGYVNDPETGNRVYRPPCPMREMVLPITKGNHINIGTKENIHGKNIR